MKGSVGIIGGGEIGAGWARLLDSHGHEVRIYDEQPGRRRNADTVAEAVTGVAVVIEAVLERLDVKRSVLARAAACAPADALIASASSSILPSLLQEGLRGPERCLVLHPLHPVDLLPVVEVVPGAQTESAVTVRATEWLRTLGKIPVVLRKETPGYVVNRLVAALCREAVNLVLAGVIDPHQLDVVASRGPCLGWAVQGPFLTYHLAAPEGFGAFWRHVGPAFEQIWQTLSDRTALGSEEAEALIRLVDQAYGGSDRQWLEQARDTQLKDVVALLADLPVCKDGVEVTPFSV